jgi:hypothetical protein
MSLHLRGSALTHAHLGHRRVRLAVVWPHFQHSLEADRRFFVASNAAWIPPSHASTSSTSAGSASARSAVTTAFFELKAGRRI